METIIERILGGRKLEFGEALDLAKNNDPEVLFDAADTIRKHLHKNHLELCSIVNAKSGKCSEDCKFCAQSAHYDIEVASYDLVDVNQAIQLAKESEAYGVQRFSLVTAGRSVSEKHLRRFKEMYKTLQEETQLSLCASMGFLTPEKALKLKEMGVTRYHCNLETSRSFFPRVCTTHTWDEKVATIRIAQSAGLEVCSGGILGMGESFEQRLELAFELRELGILSIPLNILTPIQNTPFENLKPLTVAEVITCVAMFRLISPEAVIRIAGGRNLLGEAQDRYFRSGANGAMVGNYLTTSGNTLAKDLEMFRKLGFDVPPNNRNDVQE